MIDLSRISTRAPEDWSKDKTKETTKEMVKEVGRLQHIMYAEKKHSLLVILQGMDASGKDGATRKMFRYCTVSGLDVKAFKKPTEEEFNHDFLWRVHKHTPEKGMIQIHNRSHYEDVLIQRVHKWITEEHAIKRIESINAFEELLEYDNNTKVLKFYLHISQEQQKEELQERLDEPEKHWKHNPNDWKEAALWNEYMRCYEDAINRSSIPWHIVPVDQRWYRDYVIADILLNTLRELDPQLPKLKVD